MSIKTVSKKKVFEIIFVLKLGMPGLIVFKFLAVINDGHG